ncbi:uncharacterized protein VTP21DRAFT_10474 [Calcarisporiella thermophila]|uniref:uncharacterized protein n=1 Tax=Calcarisporiella thermophila TaxID=911321 RepID=UPI0037434707
MPSVDPPAPTPINSGTFPLLTREDVLNCSFSSWYGKFRRITIKSKIIPLPEDFVEYLNADGVFVPQDNTMVSSLSDDEEIDNVESIADESDDEKSKRNIPPSFPAIESQIREAIEEFEGAVFPKLNWSSPRDAYWISSTGSLKCSSPTDVFLLLKASDFIAHDLSHAFERCHNQSNNEESRPPVFELVLRKWYDLPPSMEFRCFIRDGKLIAISQRDMSYYPFLEEMRDELRQKIVDFYECSIQGLFPSQHFVLDVYMTRNRDKLFIIDFNPFSLSTDSLLFSWQDIISLPNATAPEIRFIASHAEANAARCAAAPFSHNRYPSDIVELSDGESIADFARRFHQEMRNVRET